MRRPGHSRSPRPGATTSTICNCCLCLRCTDSGSNIVLPARAKCISGTTYQRNHRHLDPLCDCLVFWRGADQDLAAAVELKSGRVSAGRAFMQIQAGANLIAQHAAGATLRFVPVLVIKRSDPFEIRFFDSHKIRFGDKKILVRRAKAGSSLENVVARSEGFANLARRPKRGRSRSRR